MRLVRQSSLLHCFRLLPDKERLVTSRTLKYFSQHCRGQRLYDGHLRGIPEPEHTGEFVDIDLDAER